MIKITKITNSTETGVEFSIAIPPEYLSVIIEAGINALIFSGAAQMVEMTRQEFDANPPKAEAEKEMSEQEQTMWSNYLGKVDPKDLPQS